MGSAGGFGNIRTTHNGYGGRSRGQIYLDQNQKLYVCVGQQAPPSISYKVSWNGGGASPIGWNASHHGGAGGGATDIRILSAGEGSTDWQTGLNSRIIIAGGGGGAVSKCSSDSTAGHGGGLNGATVYNIGYPSGDGGSGGSYPGGNYSTGASQTAPGRGIIVHSCNGSGFSGFYGLGATGDHCCGGGGGGLYGGGTAYVNGGSGGSGYIADYPGCNTIWLKYQHSLMNFEIRNPRMDTGYWNDEGYVQVLLIERLD